MTQQQALDIARVGRYLRQSLHLMVGMPDYGTYLAHMAATHPEDVVMTYEEFFRDRQDAKYGGRGRMARCC